MHPSKTHKHIYINIHCPISLCTYVSISVHTSLLKMLKLHTTHYVKTLLA